MSVGEIADMDVIADRGAVRRRIVRPEDGSSVGTAHRGFDNQRYQMSFGRMLFANFAPWIRSSRIEIAQAHRPQAMRFAIPAQDLFHEQFGLAIGVHRVLRMMLRNRHILRHAVSGAG